MQIVILLYDGLTALDAIGPYEVLSCVPNATISFVAESNGPIRTDTNALALMAEATLTEVPQPDVLLIPGGNTGTIAAAQNQQILDWVRSAYATSRWTTSVCTGAMVLGAAGLLKGKRATTYWSAGPFLESNYGATYIAERYVQDGKIVTAAGVSAGIDMALFLASQLTDTETAQAIQLALEYDPQPPFASGAPHKTTQAIIEKAQSLLREGKRR
ncbi:DJ-1/PfpI family protein [Ktedonosporobacter rubrisoli]|uniref:DJ-1/PfpI family protein n=1 Tax=Ktedonosporobacter rubrisoli TaxID=2509675 RepID=A0A4P6K2M3_KTERU|nr:DJ-1/PfpI family protein [Ktedonosporobacter rubrisoli]QBD82275.1 DJ-1/PfpI family protein [Ktedonosporobacter rubrisoli]